MNRYRYITNGTASPYDSLDNFRLVSGNKLYGEVDVIRVEIPENIKLDKFICDSYSTTDDKTALKDLNPKVVIRVNGRMKVSTELTKLWLEGIVAPHEFCEYMGGFGYYINLRFGYITKSQMNFCSKYHDKLWQFESIPSSDKVDTFYTEEVYKDKYKDIIEYMRGLIDGNEKYKELQSLSDVELVDFYASTCFVYCDDTRIKDTQRMNKIIISKLDDKVRWL